MLKGKKKTWVEKEILPKILPYAGTKERRNIAIYAIISIILVVPMLIARKEYIDAVKRRNKKIQRKRKR